MAGAAAFFAERPARAAAIALACLLVAGCRPTAPEADGPPFDFYVLALSWSPSFCVVEGVSSNRRQCEADPPHGFVVHGLWPQYEEGWPEFCEPGSEEWVPDEIVATIVDLIPSPGLVGHQWRRHGSCSGLSQEEYFALARMAWETVSLPGIEGGAVSPGAVGEAFITANPGLSADAMAVTCDATHLREVRLCLTRDLAFRDCPEVAARACRAESVLAPALRDH